MKSKDFLVLGRITAGLVSDKKAEDIKLLDVRRVTSVADYCLLASTQSQPQLEAVRDHVSRVIEEKSGLKPLHRDGVNSRQWTVLDYGGLVVHLFEEEARRFYGLERLWEGARTVDWREAPAPKRAPAKRGRAGRTKARKKRGKK